MLVHGAAGHTPGTRAVVWLACNVYTCKQLVIGLSAGKMAYIMIYYTDASVRQSLYLPIHRIIR
jgi:hypothetical protein